MYKVRGGGEGGGGEGDLQESFEKDARFYDGKQKLQKIMNTALLSRGLLSMIVAVSQLATSKGDLESRPRQTKNTNTNTNANDFIDSPTKGFQNQFTSINITMR